MSYSFSHKVLVEDFLKQKNVPWRLLLLPLQRYQEITPLENSSLYPSHSLPLSLTLCSNNLFFISSTFPEKAMQNEENKKETKKQTN